MSQDMEPREIGSVLRHPAAGNQIAACVQAFPYLQARPSEGKRGMCLLVAVRWRQLSVHSVLPCTPRLTKTVSMSPSAAGGAAAPHHPHRAAHPAQHHPFLHLEGWVREADSEHALLPGWFPS